MNTDVRSRLRGNLAALTSGGRSTCLGESSSVPLCLRLYVLFHRAKRSRLRLRAGARLISARWVATTASPTAWTTPAPVVGDSGNGNGDTHGFTWTQAGGMRDLGTLGGSFSSAVAINASGMTAGYGTTTDDLAQHAVRWSATGPATDLGHLGGDDSSAIAINTADRSSGRAARRRSSSAPSRGRRPAASSTWARSAAPTAPPSPSMRAAR